MVANYVYFDLSNDSCWRFNKTYRFWISITEWEFFKGFFPPINNDAWIAYFEAYKQIPEFKLQNYSMTLSEFKVIFWWEWAHRFFGRVIGLAFLIPLIFFLSN